MFIVHLISWLILLALTPISIWILWVKYRGALNGWIRPHRHQDRWLLSITMSKDSPQEEIDTTLHHIVSEARNMEWNASCAYQQINPDSKELILGLIADNQPLNSQISEPFTLTNLPACNVLRLSGSPRHEGTTLESELDLWLKDNPLQIASALTILSAQSFKCREWIITNDPYPSAPNLQINLLDRLSEKVYEMRDIVLYPSLMTIIAAVMIGTGSTWLFGVGIFTMILLSGACKFVFIHQREDITQESHLQNY
jgi:hypothetical protein